MAALLRAARRHAAALLAAVAVGVAVGVAAGLFTWGPWPLFAASTVATAIVILLALRLDGADRGRPIS